jgi:hypothetical protein
VFDSSSFNNFELLVINYFAWADDNNFIRCLAFILDNAFGQFNTFLRELPHKISKLNNQSATERVPSSRLLISEHAGFADFY